jgi:hypothetical protein
MTPEKPGMVLVHGKRTARRSLAGFGWPPRISAVRRVRTTAANLDAEADPRVRRGGQAGGHRDNPFDEVVADGGPGVPVAWRGLAAYLGFRIVYPDGRVWRPNIRQKAAASPD